MGSVNRDDELDNLCLIYIRGSRMRIVTRHPRLHEAIQIRLTYTHKQFKGRKLTFFPSPCFHIDEVGRNRQILTGVGFLPVINDLAEACGVPVEVYDVDGDDAVRTDVYELSRLNMRIPRREWPEFRAWQQDAIKFVRKRRRGCFSVSTGAGKSFLIARLCRYLPDYRILVIAKGKQNIKDLFTAIASEYVDVAYVDGSSRSNLDSRVICCTLQSVGKLHGIKFDVVFGDEIHEHGSEKLNSLLWEISTKRMFGFSANVGDRADGADMWSEALYGQVLVQQTYKQSVAAGDVMDIKVRMLHMPTGPKPAELECYADRHEIYRNRFRNQTFVNAVKFHLDNNEQCILMTRTTEHALLVRKLLDVPVVFNDPNQARSQLFARMGLLRPDDDFSSDRNDELKNAFAAGKIPCVISNVIWKQGVDFPKLAVLASLDTVVSKISRTQLVGRLSRTDKGQKRQAILYDSWDEWNTERSKQAIRRAEFYRSQGWSVE